MVITAGKAIVKRILGRRGLALSNRILVRAQFIRRFGLRFYRMSLFKWIDGFLGDEEAVRLFTLATGLPGDGPVVVEIGSWMGKSAVVLGVALSRKRHPTLACVDPFDGSGDEQSVRRYQCDLGSLKGPLRKTFEQNVKRAGLSSIVEILQGHSTEVVQQWARPIDMLFIDGNHEFDCVNEDFVSWSRFVKPGGIVAFHDAYLEPVKASSEHFTGPGRVIEEHVLGDPTWKPVDYVGSLFVVRKDGPTPR